MERLKIEYAEAAAFIKSIKWTLLITALLFFAIAIGSHFAFWAAIEANPDTVNEIMSELESLFLESKDIVNDEGDIHPVKLFFNNVIASVFSTALGFIPFLFIPALALFTNAALMGAMTSLLKYMQLDVFLHLLVAVVPHGIFEIPALIISLACGFLLCKELTAKCFHRNRREIIPLIGELARVLVLIVVPLLALAAIIETYITPLFITLIQ
ncbi:MAG: stage II sporulation protein M [Oscillospiraceae bacterium]|nr:stage II sporulation protein M [Oscillospiraceae bacterium]